MFAYEVLTEEQAMQERFQLMKAGEYDAVIISSADKVSVNSGNPMMEMVVNVFDDEGKSHEIRDYLVFTKTMMWRVIHFADSAGLLKEYENKKLCSKVAAGKRIRVKIIIEEGSIIPEDKLKGKPLGSRYPDKNKIEDYIKKDDGQSSNDVSKNDPFDDDDVVF